MKITIAALSVAAVLLISQSASAQSIFNAARPQAMPGQPGFVLIASSMNNFHPPIGNSAIAVNSNAAMIPLLSPALPMYRPQYSTFRTMPFATVPTTPPAVLPADPTRIR